MSNSYFMSIVLHAGLFVAALLVTPPLIDKLADKEITVEIIETPKVAAAIDAGAAVKVEASPLKASSISTFPLSWWYNPPSPFLISSGYFSRNGVQTVILLYISAKIWQQ